MKLKRKLVPFILILSQWAFSQVKIGENPNIIDLNSLIELESSDKALVLTRLTNAQMIAITPLNGALVYNTDFNCVYFFDAVQWINLCENSSGSGFSFTDNGDGTITLTDSDGATITFNGASETISTLVDNLDGTFTYTNENNEDTVLTFTNSDNQNLVTDGNAGNIGIENGNSILINVDDADADAGNELQDLQFSSGIISLTDDPDATTIDISAYDTDATDDFSGAFADLSGIPADIADGDNDTTYTAGNGLNLAGTEFSINNAEVDPDWSNITNIPSDIADGDNQNLANVLTNGNDANNTRIINLGAPTDNADATTKTYVDNLPRVYVGTFRITAAGAVSITGLPFEPSSVTFTAYANVEDFDLNSDNGVGNNNSGLANAYGNMRGFARNDGGTISEQVIYIGGSGNSINDISRFASSSHCIGLRYSNQNGNSLGLTTATVTTFDANGFTLNTDNFADGIVVIFEAYR